VLRDNSVNVHLADTSFKSYSDTSRFVCLLDKAIPIPIDNTLQFCYTV